MNTVPLINGRAYDYASIELILAGSPLVSVSSISYVESQEKMNNYGLGTLPTSRGRGTKEVSVSMDIAMNEVENLRTAVFALDSLSKGSLLSLPAFDILVSFFNGQSVVVHTVKNCEFTDDGVEGSTGDGELKRSFNLIASHVEYR